MATLADASTYLAGQRTVVKMAFNELRALWRRIERLDAIGKRDALLELWPRLVQRYGDANAELAARRFEELTGFSPIMAPPLSDEDANARMRWGISPQFSATPDDAATMARLSGALDALVRNAGRQTMLDSARGHDLRVARVPSGSETCAWCLMLASRGFDYVSKKSALAASHSACDCRVAVEGEDVGDYDPEALYEIYNNAAHAVDGNWRTDPKAILAEMREREGIR